MAIAGSAAQGMCSTEARHATRHPAAHRDTDTRVTGVCRGSRPEATHPPDRVWGSWRVRAACACATCCMRARTAAANCKVTPEEGISPVSIRFFTTGTPTQGDHSISGGRGTGVSQGNVCQLGNARCWVTGARFSCSSRGEIRRNLAAGRGARRRTCCLSLATIIKDSW